MLICMWTPLPHYLIKIQNSEQISKKLLARSILYVSVDLQSVKYIICPLLFEIRPIIVFTAFHNSVEEYKSGIAEIKSKRKNLTFQTIQAATMFGKQFPLDCNFYPSQSLPANGDVYRKCIYDKNDLGTYCKNHRTDSQRNWKITFQS